MVFNDELKFEDALVDVLLNCGWNDPGGVLIHPSEQDLIDNWANILFENNKDIDRLNGCPLTQGEMQQILEQINTLRTPVALNGFINGKTVAITRDNPNDNMHFGKEVSLKIYDRDEIAGGQSRYQIARQPHYAAKAPLLNSRRGDVVLLINGMPVIHIELKRSGVQVSQAEEQIRKYAHEGVFTGLFSLVQIFVAMTPDETRYFANPGSASAFNRNFFFHWADFNNEPVNDYKDVATQLLSIPMAHQLIGFYTVADSADGVLKVMRSYQYFAASRISDRVFSINRQNAWGAKNTRGGYVWHTTGSGKTMTSFKSAQLIANSKDADKVVFLVDRIELGTQSLGEYQAFADDSDNVQGTENTEMLKAKLKSDDPAHTLIVTSIQKMSNIKEEGGMNARDLEKMRSKRIVFIIDECHRSTFGDMLISIKTNFPDAVFFGFTGTPIHEENKRRDSTTASVFGNELHRYSIADGIRDKNVLGFDPYMVLTYPNDEVRRAVALDEAKAESVDEALSSPAKSKIFYYYMDTSKVPMATEESPEKGKLKGIEDFVPEAQYGTPDNDDVTAHQIEVVQDIKKKWVELSRNGKFHAIFATHSIAEAVQYYRLLKREAAEIKVAALFDPNIDNNEKAIFKEDGLVELLRDYNERYNKEFTLPTFTAYKKDVAARLAHKQPYVGIERTPAECLDLLVVVDQMLTGFDSKWVNTLYLDKVLHYEGIIQAFSRTNRLFGEDKPFGVIRYYRRPNTMKREIEKAVKLYSGDKPFGLFVDKLPDNIAGMNRCYEEIQAVFQAAGIDDFAHLPQDDAAKGKFASLFKQLNQYLEAARVQGFLWGQPDYHYDEEDGSGSHVAFLSFDETAYLTLALRYKEIFVTPSDPTSPLDVPFDIDTHLIEIDTGRIDTEYMNSNFSKWLKELAKDSPDVEAVDRALVELHRSFATLSQDEQRCAELFIHDVQCGDVRLESDKTFRDYVTDYQQRAKNQQVAAVVEAFGVDESKLTALMAAKVTPANINEFDRFDDLIQTLDTSRAKRHFEAKEGGAVPLFKVRARADSMLRKFILEGGFDIS